MSLRTIAHRGDSFSARENTIEAVLAAVEAGADTIEIDIRTSADRRSVVLHDASTLRLWGRAQLASEQTVAQLQELGVSGTRIPTLGELVQALADLGRPVHLLVDTVDVDDAVVAWTELRTHPGVRDDAVRISWCGLSAAMQRIRELDAEADLRHNHYGGPLDLELLERTRPSVVNCEWTCIDAALVDQVHRLGLEIAVWTVDDGEQMTWLIDAGVDAITTNRPRTLHQLVTGGHSSLGMAWASAEELAARTGVELEMARWVHVARQLAQWQIEFVRTASLGRIDDKANPADVVTEVDTAVERHFREVLAAEFGDHLVVGEEYGGRAEPGRPTWYIDPVDGTTNLANNLPWNSMSLALAIDDQPLVAATTQPWTGELFLAARGMGAARNGVPLQVKKVDSLAGKALLVETSALGLWPGLLELVDGLAREHCAVRVMGSGTLTMTRVAANSSVGGLVPGFSAIDHLAGVLIAAEAGARVMNSDGDDALFPSSGGLLIAPPGAAEKLWPIWQEALKAAAAQPAG
ncbi:inositol monophosphatase family protein [Aestuariimicrobium ganziense]|uniref:inositol monophosphatase family protein n=1 Tax=Aestuariimicrobium ganziense TaxID=2773677 RepID=UPI0019414833|nr:inositol monophosphatase family protein [Aestuariimicrobium ganziense]